MMSTRVVAEAQAQVLVDDTVELFTPAEKIDEIALWLKTSVVI